MVMAGCVDTDLVIFTLFILYEGVSDMCPEQQNLTREFCEAQTWKYIAEDQHIGPRTSEKTLPRKHVGELPKATSPTGRPGRAWPEHLLVV